MKKLFAIALFVCSVVSLALVGCKSTAQAYILSGQNDKAKNLFTSQADINMVDKHGNTALHAAAKKNQAEMIEFLILRGANSELKNKEGDTPLHVAVKNDSYEAAGVLAKMSANIFAKNAGGTMALDSALNKSEVYYDIVINESTSKMRDASNGNSIIHYFVLSQNKNAIDFAINKRLNIDARNFNGESPLALALKKPESLAFAEIAADLIYADADIVPGNFELFEQGIAQRDLSIRNNDGQTPLHIAIIYAHTGIAQYLLNNGADIRAQNISGSTPLHEAARYGQTQIARQLIMRGADVNSRDSIGKTPLLVLIPDEKQMELYSLLLNSGATINHKDMYGDGILHVATMSGMENEVMQMLINQGADLNMRNKNGTTPIALAITHGNERQVKFLANQGADIHAADAHQITPLVSVLKRGDYMYESLINEKNVISADSEGNRPLMIAIKVDASYEAIDYIESLDPNINASNIDGESALFIAVQRNNKEAGELLLKNNADIFSVNKNNISPLRLALELDNSSAEWLLNSKTISARDGSGNTPLHYAAEWNLRKSLIEFIVQLGADVNAQNSNNETPLFSAARGNNTNSIDVLVDNGANLNARNYLGNTALHTAVKWDAYAAAEQLLRLGLDVNSQNYVGTTPLNVAATEENLGMARLLLQNRADPNKYDSAGATSLTLAIRKYNYEMVRLLLNANANPKIQDINGSTPYHEAARSGNIAIINMMRQAGANPLARDRNGNTPLSIAFSQNIEVMSAVVGSDRTIADSDGNTPLHIALQKRADYSMIESLIDKGFPFDTRNSSGQTPLSTAVSSGQRDSAALLLERGANPFTEINSKGDNTASLALKDLDDEILGYIVKYSSGKSDIRGNTLLHYAARLSDENVVGKLLSLGLYKEAKNISNETPRDVAMKWKKYGNANLLQ